MSFVTHKVSGKSAPDVGKLREATYSAMETADDAATLVLDKRGMIRGCNSACEKLFGYRRSEVVWQHVSMLLPQLAEIELIENGGLNPRVLFLCHIGGYFQAINRSGERFASDLILLDLYNPGSSDLRMIVRRDQTGLRNARSNAQADLLTSN